MLVCLCTSGVQGAAGLHGAIESARRQITLSDGWLVKQLDTDKPDVAALARESASPDKSWLTARMPAQVHDVLLAHGLIPDPHVGTNAAALRADGVDLAANDRQQIWLK
jgi:hypothetical protein